MTKHLKFFINLTIFSGCYNPHFTTVGVESAASVHFDAAALHYAFSTDGFGALGRSGCPPAGAAADGLVGQTRLAAAVVPAAGDPAGRTGAAVLHSRGALSVRRPWQPGPQVQLLRTGIHAASQAH
jgi:hypothetical protein